MIADRSHTFRPIPGATSNGIRQDRFYDPHTLMRPSSNVGLFVRKIEQRITRQST